jgi:hypothetical protein
VGLLVGGGLYLAFTRAPVVAEAPVVPVGTGIDA